MKKILIAVVLLASVTLIATDQTASLQAFWEFDDLLDSHSTNHLTDHNTVPFVSGKVGSAADFEFTNNEYLSIADNAALSIGAFDFTLCGWVKLESSTGASQVLVSRWDAGSSVRDYRLVFNNTDFQFVIDDAGSSVIGDVSSSAFGAISTGTWYFLCAGHDETADQIWMQLNGGTTYTSAMTGDPVDQSIDTEFGARNQGTTEYLDGMLDQWGFWKRKLSDAEMDEQYNSGNGVDYDAIDASVGGGGTNCRRLLVNVGCDDGRQR